MLYVVISFNMTIMRESELVVHRREIAAAYVRSWFVPDLLAAFPWNTVCIQLLGLKGKWRLVSMMKLTAVHKLYRLRSVRKDADYQLNNPELFRWARNIQLLLVTISLAHWLACGWFVVTQPWNAREELGQMWDSERWPEFDSMSQLGQYMACLHDVYCMMLQNAMKPQTPSEKAYAMLVMTIGAMVIAVVFGSIGVFIQSLDAQVDWIRGHIDTLAKASDLYALPGALQTTIKKFYLHRYFRKAYFNDQSFLTELSPDLRKHVLWRRYKSIVTTIDLFKDCSYEMKQALTTRMRTVYFAAGDLIFCQGDIGTTLYAVGGGKVEIRVVNQTTSKEFRKQLGAGSCFGELSLVKSHGARRSASCLALTFVTLEELTKAAFQELMNEYPDDRRLMLMTMITKMNYELDREDIDELGADPDVTEALLELQMKKLFERIDTDGSGTVDADEIAAVLKAKGRPEEAIEKMRRKNFGVEYTYEEFKNVLSAMISDDTDEARSESSGHEVFRDVSEGLRANWQHASRDRPEGSDTTVVERIRIQPAWGVESQVIII